MSGHRDVDTGDVVARGAPPVGFVRFQLVLWVLLLAAWGLQAARDPEPIRVVMVVVAVVSVAAYTWLTVGASPVELVLRGETLVLRRPFRTTSLERADVVAVRGDVPGRPSWSSTVEVETAEGRTVRLPALDRGPGDLVVLLQEWAGVGETRRD